MFGTENAGLHEAPMRFRMLRRENKGAKRATQEAISIPRTGVELNQRREMYFAVRSPVRWTL
jgi:hypothetical protein